MKIKAIEPTPSPNTMKVLLDEELSFGTRNNYNIENVHTAPKEIQSILAIEGVKGVYHVADFLAVERNTKYDWKPILQNVRAVFGEADATDAKKEAKLSHYGEVKVFVQVLYDIPMQVKLTDGEKEQRYGLPDYFKASIMKLQFATPNVVKERKWIEQGTRYGEFDEIGQEVVDEVTAAFSKERVELRIQELLDQPDNKELVLKRRDPYHVTLEMMEDPDWKKRYAALEQMNPSEEDIPVLEKALLDTKVSIRRLATAYLGMIKGKQVLPLLLQALQDKAVSVRRTAGDCLSDIGDKAAIPAMIAALEDSSKLVRWRAAMFLFEEGDETALPALKLVEHDTEFEVVMQAKLAIERIEGGEEAKGSVWKQMTELRRSK